MKILVLLIAGILLAEDTEKVVPPELTSEFFWADAQYVRAQSALDAAARDRDAALSSLGKFCGEIATPSVSKTNPRKIICVAKPK